MQNLIGCISVCTLTVCYVLTFAGCGAVDYKDIIDSSKPEEFVNLTSDDSNIKDSRIEKAELKQIILTELANNGQQLTPDIVDFLENPIQGSGKFEGDIELPPSTEIDPADSQDYSALAYNAIVDRRFLWPGREIPYLISNRYGKFARHKIYTAISEINKYTCLKLVGRSSQADYIVIKPILGCASHIGRMGGTQYVSIAAGCIEKASIIHELLHAGGLYHEQARYDRDHHVLVHWNNIIEKPAIRDQFKIQNRSVITLLGTPYDQYSIMHYRSNAFSKDPSRLATISARNGDTLSNDVGMTEIDILKINRLYGCPDISGNFTNQTSRIRTTISPLTQEACGLLKNVVFIQPLNNQNFGIQFRKDVTQFCLKLCAEMPDCTAVQNLANLHDGPCRFITTAKRSINDISHFSAVTYEKVCIEVPNTVASCLSYDIAASPVTFTSESQKLLAGSERDVLVDVSRDQCLTECVTSAQQRNFTCGSVNYRFDTRRCTLNSGTKVDGVLRQVMADVEYIEYYCNESLGFVSWEPWGFCEADVQIRTRKCSCSGERVEKRTCQSAKPDTDDKGNIQNSDPMVYIRKEGVDAIKVNVRLNRLEEEELPFVLESVNGQSYSIQKGDKLLVALVHLNFTRTFTIYDLATGNRFSWLGTDWQWSPTVFFANDSLFKCEENECFQYNGVSFMNVNMSLVEPRSYWAAASVVTINGEPCVTGGNPFHRVATECLHRSGYWYVNNRLPTIARYDHMTVIHGQLLYLCGGSFNNSLLLSCIKYDLVARTETIIEGFPPYYYFDLIIWKDKLSAIGLVGKHSDAMRMVRVDVDDITRSRQEFSGPCRLVFLLLQPCLDCQQMPLKEPLAYTRLNGSELMTLNIASNYISTGDHLPIVGKTEYPSLYSFQWQNKLLTVNFDRTTFMRKFVMHDLESGHRQMWTGWETWNPMVFSVNQSLFECRKRDCYEYNGTIFVSTDITLIYERNQVTTASVVVVNGEPCVTGGRTYQEVPTECLRSSGKWYVNERLPALQRYDHMSIVHLGFLYVCGGGFNNSLIDTCTKYGLTSRTEVTITGLPEYYYFNLYVFDDKVVAIGLTGEYGARHLVKFHVDNELKTTETFTGPFDDVLLVASANCTLI